MISKTQSRGGAVNQYAKGGTGCHTDTKDKLRPKKGHQRLQTGHELEPNATQGRARTLVGARRHRRKTKEAAAQVHRGTRWDPSDEMGADMVTNSLQKGVQLGDPGDDQNRAPAAAKARSSMSKTSQKEQQNSKCEQKLQTWRLQGPKRAPREPKMEP